MCSESLCMAQQFEPIETQVGIISGRDAFYLDNIHFEYIGKQGTTIRFEGSINGNLCSHNEKNLEWLKYTLVFPHVLVFQMVELDFSDFSGMASFVQVIDSDWIAECRAFDTASKVSYEHNHYIFETYDDVFDIVSRGYELNISESPIS